jgi:hypothetical protein
MDATHCHECSPTTTMCSAMRWPSQRRRSDTALPIWAQHRVTLCVAPAFLSHVKLLLISRPVAWQANALWYSPPRNDPPLPRLFISELQACVELFVLALCPAASRYHSMASA